MSRMIVDPWLLSPVVNATTLKTIKHSVEMRSLRLSAPARPRKLKIHGHVREVYGWGTWIRTRINGVRVLAASSCLPRVKPGTVLLREYQGERLTVTVVPTGIFVARNSLRKPAPV